MRLMVLRSAARVLVVVLIPACAAASGFEKPVEVVQAGHGHLYGDLVGSYSFTTPTLHVTAGGGAVVPHGIAPFGPAWLCNPCQAGSAIDVVQFTRLEGSGSATVDGATYLGITLRGRMEFQGPTVMVPAADTPVLTVPFTVSGFLGGYSENGNVIFHRDLLGFGTVVVRLKSSMGASGMVYEFDSADYSFERFLSDADVIVPGGPSQAVSWAQAVNQSGVVAGHQGQNAAFRWSSQHGKEELGDGTAHDINARGTVVGSAVWAAKGQVIDVSSQLVLSSINDRGYAVGTCHHGSACVWNEKDGVTDLGPLIERAGYLGMSAADAINNRGDILVTVWDPVEGPRRLMLRSNGQLREFTSGWPIAINSSGEAAGFRWVNGRRHAAAWTADGFLIDLGTLPGGSSQAASINDRGVVVGWGADQFQEQRAFVWTPRGGMRDLGPGGSADLNDSGMIVGWRAEYGVWVGSYEAFTWQLAPSAHR
jgi:probable HAF family extracellular repeat protein